MKEIILNTVEFFKEMSIKHNVEVDSLNLHITGDSLYVQEYQAGRADSFKLLELINLPPTK